MKKHVKNILLIIFIVGFIGCIIDPPQKPSIGTNTKNIDFGNVSQEARRELHVWNDGAGGKLNYSISIYQGITYFSVSPYGGISNGENDINKHIVKVNYIHIPEGQTKYGEIRISCSDANDSPCTIYLSATRAIEKSCDELNEQGWQDFENGNYSTAKENFEKATIKCNSEAEGYIGKGWCEFYLLQISTSITSFISALDKQPSDTQKNNIYAGLCFAHDLLDSHEECLSASNNVGSNWKFDHDNSLDYFDIIILRAISYYAKGDFESSLQEIQKIEPGFDIDVTTSEGKANLASKIEELNMTE